MLRGLMVQTMYVLIADQVGSRGDVDRVAGALDELTERFGTTYALAPERTAGDELQALTNDAACALESALHLLRSPHWRVGIGAGLVRLPLPTSVREASGPAFTSARAAVERATTRSTRFAAVGAERLADPVHDWASLVDLLLAQRTRWSAQGWELHDLLEQGLTQAEAATRLGITPQAASKRARAAGLRIDADARRALPRLVTVVGGTVEGPAATAATGTTIDEGAS
ncbi:DNA-binding protein [Microcella sp.]|uniref:DNA-binding protein n=1 Tax=Microcella sp. TaxID=1913979 RepID=UPI00255F0238|nr:DNA-binding protein [Microcella sp.]MBX9470520.1 SatD family protein [Microcella sp.]